MKHTFQSSRLPGSRIVRICDMPAKGRPMQKEDYILSADCTLYDAPLLGTSTKVH